MLKELIASKYYNTDKFTSHAYEEIYDKILLPIKNTAKNILEIGVYEGWSILFWRDYFINAHIYGLDIIDTPKLIIDDGDQKNITIIKHNAYDHNFMQKFFIDKNIKFDFILDDGPHSFESFEFFAQHYPALLAPNGIMVIEDISTIEIANHIIKYLPSNIRHLAQIIDLRHIKNRGDDILIVLQS